MGFWRGRGIVAGGDCGPPASGPRPARPLHGWDSLTPTEHKVVELAAEGLTNPQIATRLFVSPRTVQSHLAHVFAKLHVSTHAELDGAATARALDPPPE